MECLDAALLQFAEQGSFDYAFAPLREANAPLRKKEFKRCSALKHFFFQHRFLKIIQRHSQPGFEVDLRFPSQQGSCLCYIGLALLGVILRQRFVAKFAFRAGYRKHALGASENRELSGISDIDRQMLGRFRQSYKTVDLIAYVAEA